MGVKTVLVFAVVLMFSVRPLHADDRVEVNGLSGIGTFFVTGEVIEWDSDALMIRRKGEADRRIETERIVDVDTVRLADHIAANSAFARGDVDKAVVLWEKALGRDSRLWIRREILAELIRAETARTQYARAGEHFLQILKSDPRSFWFHRIPLVWTSEPPAAEGRSIAKGWLDDDTNSVAQLLGASILLFDAEHGSAALERLDRLSVSTDERIFPLARFQEWRARVYSRETTVNEAVRYERMMEEEVPKEFRGGPRFLVGQAFAKAGASEQAAVNWLWLPLVYDDDPSLAALAELNAARELSQIGRTADSIVLLNEVSTRFAYTASAEVARNELDKLGGASGGLVGKPVIAPRP